MVVNERILNGIVANLNYQNKLSSTRYYDVIHVFREVLCTVGSAVFSSCYKCVIKTKTFPTFCTM